jgi:hypothetical protein
MAQYVSSFDDFLGRYERVAEDCDLFAFFLVSNQMSHHLVNYFISREFSFFNQLAIRNKMFFYLFRLVNTRLDYNPSAEISEIFNVPLAKLPGILIFTGSDTLEEAKGLFFPIDIRLFKVGGKKEPTLKDVAEGVEKRITGLFDEISRARAISDSPEEIIENLVKHLPKWQKADRWRPIITYASSQTIGLKKIPGGFIKKLAEGFARGLVRFGE